MRNRCRPNCVGRRRAASPLAPHRHDHTRFAAALARPAGWQRTGSFCQRVTQIEPTNLRTRAQFQRNVTPSAMNAEGPTARSAPRGLVHVLTWQASPIPPGARATGIDAARTHDRKAQAGRYSSMTVADPRTSPTLLRGKSIRRECNGERGRSRLASCWSLVHPSCRAERRPSPRASVPPGGLRDPAPPLVSRST